MSDANTSAASGSNAIVSFDFEGKSVRGFEYAGEPYFVGNEVAAALGYANPKNAVQAHCKSLKLLKSLESGLLGIPCGPRGMNIIPERDVYRLVMRSNLPTAEAFEEKVVGEILPSIRKTGGYTISKLTLPPKPSVINHATLLRKAIALHGSNFIYNKRQGMDLTQARAKANAQVLEQIGVDLPKECGWQPQPLVIQEQTLTATDIAKALALPGNKPGEAGNNLLDAAGFYSWTRDTRGRKVWTPTEQGRKFGRYEDKPRANVSGTVQPWGWYPSVLDVLRLHLATAKETPVPFAKTPEATS